MCASVVCVYREWDGLVLCQDTRLLQTVSRKLMDSLRDKQGKDPVKLALNTAPLGWSLGTGEGGRAGRHVSGVRSPGN